MEPPPVSPPDDPKPRRRRSGSETRRKMRRISYRVNDEDYRTITAAASDARVSVASYSRACVLAEPTAGTPENGEPVDRAAHRETLRAFTKVAVNFNQLTRHVNMGGVVMPDELAVAGERIEASRAEVMAALRRRR